MQLVENSSSPLVSRDSKTLSGLFAEMDTFNQNGRRYPEAIYEQAYEELLPKISERRLLGELDHPIDYDEVRLSNVSHVITETEIVESDSGVKQVWGTVELLDTPAGLIAQSLVNAGIPLGISSRGLGSTKQVRDGVDVTQLKLLTYDLVADPSFSNAILSPDKSAELSDSLHHIESNLPLNESVETQSIRDMIHRIRESFINKKTGLNDESDITQIEINSLRELVESKQKVIEEDTQRLIDSRSLIKSLQEDLKESESKYRALLKNMFKLQSSYNKLIETSTSNEEVDSLKETVVELTKQLAAEKRGIPYQKVSELLEGASTSDEIESRLNSLSSMSRKRQSPLVVDTRALTESAKIEAKGKMSRLASIVSSV